MLSATATTRDGATSARDALVEVDEARQRRDGEGPVGQVVEVVVGEARLVDQDHGLRCRAVDEAQRHRRVGGVVERALALDEDPVAQLLALLHDAFDGALDEVRHDRVDGRAPALDHDARLARGHERGAARRQPRAAWRSSSITDILPTAQSVPTARITRLPGSVAPARGRGPRTGRPSHVVERDAGRRGRRGQVRIVRRGTCAGRR